MEQIYVLTHNERGKIERRVDQLTLECARKDRGRVYVHIGRENGR